MPLPAFVENFQTLTRAFREDNALLVLFPGPNGDPIGMICAVNRLPDGSRELLPFA
jgi:hypothetical protein